MTQSPWFTTVFTLGVVLNTFNGFGQMHNDLYPPWYYRTEYFHCSKIPLCSAFSSLPTHPPNL